MRSINSTVITKGDTVLLLGAGGRLGQMIRRHWPRQGQLRGVSSQAGDGMIRLDPLADGGALREASVGVKALICLAGVTPAHARASGDAMSLNTDLALAAVDAAPPGARVFLASSAAVYGAAIGPQFESAAVSPLSDYGRAKLAMERAVLGRGDPRVCVLRIGNVAGADAILGGWQPGMALDRLADGRTPRRSYIGPQSLARVLCTLCDAPDLPPVLNIAAPGVVSMGALLDAADLAWAPREAGPEVIAELELETEMLERYCRFDPQESTPEALVAQWRADVMA